MSKSKVPVTATARLKNDYLRLKKEPIPLVYAEPDPSNLLCWHYCIRGPIDTPYEGGYYHGELRFPKEFPFKPPSILMMTPNGRFKINQRLCLSISDFHPDTWNPAWSVGTILTGLCSFMVEESKTFGSIECDSLVRKRFARQSGIENLKNDKFKSLFPELTKEIRETIIEQKTKLVMRLDKCEEKNEKIEKLEKEPDEQVHATAAVNEANENGQNQRETSFFTYLIILFFAMIAGMILNGESG